MGVRLFGCGRSRTVVRARKELTTGTEGSGSTGRGLRQRIETKSTKKYLLCPSVSSESSIHGVRLCQSFIVRVFALHL